jgi:hypothetical protein
MATQLGAGRKPDWDFAQTVFEFIKRKITIEMIPLDNAEDTLRRGTGTCLHRLSLLVALCRAGGIKARYRLYALKSMDTLDQTLGDGDFGDKWNDELGGLLLHGEAEVFVGGEWVVANVGLTAERQASLNLPITRFGEVSIDVYYSVDTTSIVRLESIPCGLNPLMKFVYRMVPATIDKSNANLLEECRRGRKILEEKGEQVYDAEARRLFKPSLPKAVMKIRREIIFER